MGPVLPGTENSVSNQGLQPVPDNQLSNSGVVPKEQEKLLINQVLLHR
jgi:hypothetical protein